MNEQSWTARVDWEQPNVPADEQMDQVMDALADYHAVLAFDYPMYPNQSPVLGSAMISVDAHSPLQAAATAVDVVEAAAGAEATGFEILTSAEWDRRLDL